VKVHHLRRLITLLVIFVLSITIVTLTPQQTSALTAINPSVSITCTGFNFMTGVILNRNNMGGNQERFVFEVRDGAGTILWSGTNFGGLNPNVQASPVVANYTVAPSFNPITFRLISPAGNGFPEQVAFSAQGNCPGLPTITPPPQFFDPKDGRINGQPGDRVVVYCNQPDQIAVYGVDNNGNGFELAAFSNRDVVAAGQSGVTKNLGATGTVSLMGTAQGNFWLAWNGGSYGANGQGNFAKAFTCAFTNPTANLRPCPSGTGPGGIVAGGDYKPQDLTQAQRQWLYQAFGHDGVAPAGYGGEACQKTTSPAPAETLKPCPSGVGPGGVVAGGDYKPQDLTQAQRQWLYQAFGHNGVAPAGYAGEACQKGNTSVPPTAIPKQPTTVPTQQVIQTVDARPNERLRVYCDITGGTISAYGVDNNGNGFPLATWKYVDVYLAGSKGIGKFADGGVISLSVDSQNNFWVAWNGGRFGANGQGPFAKAFNCAFSPISRYKYKSANWTGLKSINLNTPENSVINYSLSTIYEEISKGMFLIHSITLVMEPIYPGPTFGCATKGEIDVLDDTGKSVGHYQSKLMLSSPSLSPIPSVIHQFDVQPEKTIGTSGKIRVTVLWKCFDLLTILGIKDKGGYTDPSASLLNAINEYTGKAERDFEYDPPPTDTNDLLIP